MKLTKEEKRYLRELLTKDSTARFNIVTDRKKNVPQKRYDYLEQRIKDNDVIIGKLNP